MIRESSSCLYLSLFLLCRLPYSLFCRVYTVSTVSHTVYYCCVFSCPCYFTYSKCRSIFLLVVIVVLLFRVVVLIIIFVVFVIIVHLFVEILIVLYIIIFFILVLIFVLVLVIIFVLGVLLFLCCVTLDSVVRSI